MVEDRAIWQVELARVEGVAKAHFAALTRRVAALEASMPEDTQPTDNRPSAPPSESRPPGDERLQQWVTEASRGEDTRPDALIGEIVRFLVRADKTAFAKIYALVKTEAEKMDARSVERLRAFYRSPPKTKDSTPPPDTSETS